MTYPRFAKIFSTILLVPMAVYTASNGWLFAVIAFFSLSLFFYYFIFKNQVDFWLQNKGWKSLHWFESLADGGIKEAQIYRPLEDYEKQILGYNFLAKKDPNIDLDLRSPVFRVIGELTKSSDGQEAEVRGLKLTRKNQPDQKYQIFGAGSMVGVEFSPFSQRIWEIYQVLGDKRVWQMDFPKKSIQDIRTGQKTVDLRAPFGSHNLNQFKVGDYINYSDQSRLISVTVKIERISIYKTLELAIAAEGAGNILPDSESEIATAQYFKNLPSYEARIKQTGVFALKFVYVSPEMFKDILR